MGGKRQKKDFYNPEQKQEFLDAIQVGNELRYGEASKLTIIKTAIRLFSNSKDIEEIEKKDISQFSRDLILDFYSYMNLGNYEALRNIHTTLMSYINFCYRGAGDNRSKLLHIKTQDLKERVNKNKLKESLTTRKEVLEHIYTTQHINGDYFSACKAFMVLAVFEGIGSYDMAEFFSLKRGDLHIKDGKYYADLCTGRELEISKELYDLAILADEETGYNSPFKGSIRRSNYAPSVYIYKTKDVNLSIDRNDIESLKLRQNTRMTRCCESIKIKKMTVKEVLRSGLIDTLRVEYEKIGVNIKELFELRYKDFSEEETEIFKRVYARYQKNNPYFIKALVTPNL